MASWLLTGFELVAAERGLSPVLAPRKSGWAGRGHFLLAGGDMCLSLSLSSSQQAKELLFKNNLLVT